MQTRKELSLHAQELFRLKRNNAAVGSQLQHNEMEEAAQILKNKGLGCGKKFGAMCDKFGVSKD